MLCAAPAVLPPAQEWGVKPPGVLAVLQAMKGFPWRRAAVPALRGSAASPAQPGADDVSSRVSARFVIRSHFLCVFAVELEKAWQTQMVNSARG